MDHFTNDMLDASSLPKHEEVQITPIHPSYWNVIVFNFGIIFLLFGTALATIVFSASNLRPYAWYLLVAYILWMGSVFVVQRIAFRKRGYALRQRDLIYRRGVLATITTIIPFNRIQHVALNEGFLSRYYGLAQLQLFTAGGASSDIRISGLVKDEAERMRELIMRQIADEETEQSGNGIQ
ncbi:PH domain-containing protein [Parapedobacter tibetensis]|uniref:PH domain-containing protein n=1 Tax=Parapedobacter tibetensis TaxID=2972951 RepID=UPI00214DE462|nr:PH domain-containing protein [Parapedobacter tibetensis]